MYLGFDFSFSIERTTERAALLDEWKRVANESFESQNAIVHKSLDEFLGEEGSLNGTKIQEEWFPQVQADIFLSHSHDDMDTALYLSGMFQEVFGLNVFIDSTVWGYADELLMKINNRQSKIKEGLYDLDGCNQASSHVNMMLSVALSKMMDQCECLFFLNTPNSVTTSEVVSRTKSPWIYAEIAQSRLIRKKAPTRRFTKSFSKGGKAETLAMITENIEYDLELDHLYKLNHSEFLEWLENIKEDQHPLDSLYKFVINRAKNI
ncbi:MAG: hypothetical protein QNK23_16425 [Crocinitomicaceae bacterium]|nr:hypothetical protein [Crocinitomicaceae bacterium]